MSARKALTLVEMLVVMAVVGILVALLIPAVQAARESARRTQCANNQKQVALATLNHVSARGRLPAIINPRFKYKPHGLGSWRITILPFLEEQGMYDVLFDARWEPADR